MIFSFNVSALTIIYEDDDGKIVKLNDFLDTQGHWAHDTILKVADYGLIVGSNGKFMPNQPIKRGDLAIILDRMLGLRTISYNYFNDLNNSEYYAESLLKCVAAEYITGTGANQIDPNGYATREQVAVIISRIFDLDTGYSGTTNFKDDNKISSWARSSVSAMSRLGYINGDDRGYVNPQSYITRAELVTLLNNFANTYIPKKDTSSFASTEYKNNFPTNVVTSRNITLNNSSVNRDLILTPSATSITLNETIIKGRLLLMGKQSVTLSDSTINEIVLLNTSTIRGVTDNIHSVHVYYNASESTLDKIPQKIILESGARIKVNGIMYENESTRVKTYYASDLQADIAEEQNYIMGGPRITGVKFEQDMDNTITVSGIRITEGDSQVKEIGVVWLEQDDNENAQNPTYKKNDGKKIYRSDKIDEVIEFEVGEVEGTCAYRVYVKDKDGLFAYSNSTIFSEYEYTTTLKIYDNNYPENVDVELVFKGNSVPDINNVRVVYDIDELYSEEHNEISLSLYSDKDLEVQPDTTKYKRYIATIKCKKEKINGEYVYTPPTAFGYIITFKNGTLINRFPILTDAIPEGVSPMANLDTGSASYNGSTTLTISNNKITTRYTIPQEVGVVYKTSTNESVSNPTVSSSSWERKAAYVNLDVNESETFNVSIPLTKTEGYTYYCAYVKTSNGYWYGDVKKFNNNVKGDEGGPIIANDIVPIVLDANTVIIPINYTNSNPLSTNYESFIKDIRKNGVTDTEWLSNNYDRYSVNIYDSDNSGYILIKGLQEKTFYEVDIQLKDILGLKSSSCTVSINTSNFNKVSIANKTASGDSGISYDIIYPNNVYKVEDISIVNGVGNAEIMVSSDYKNVVVKNSANTNVLVTYITRINGTGYICECRCQQTLVLN